MLNVYQNICIFFTDNNNLQSYTALVIGICSIELHFFGGSSLYSIVNCCKKYIIKNYTMDNELILNNS